MTKVVEVTKVGATDVCPSVSEDLSGRRGAMGLISLTAARKAVKQMCGRASQNNWLD